MATSVLYVFPTENSDAADEPTDEPTDIPKEVGSTDEDATIITTTAETMATETLTEITNSILLDEDDHQLEFILMVLIPLILLALLLLSVVVIMIRYKRKKTKQGRYLACSQFQTIASCASEQSTKQNPFFFPTQNLLSKDLRVFSRHVSIILTLPGAGVGVGEGTERF